MNVYRKYVPKLIAVATLACLGTVGCATATPPELKSARQAYQRASVGLAAQAAPAELHKARASLDQAEKAFGDEPKSQRARDLAYVAERKAELAEAIAQTRQADRTGQQAERTYQHLQGQAAQRTKNELAATRSELKDTEQARREAERQTADALAKLAAVKDEDRGLVITLSGSVLFASNQSTLLPTAQSRLNDVADVLLATKGRTLTVEGHTDSQGSASYNLQLSQRRADAVRSYLISRGYPAEEIQARGMGLEQPVADNASPEGRANNRRVEIIVDHARSASR